MFNSLFFQNNVVNVEMVEGQLLIKDQICEYMDRGNALEHWSCLDYFLDTYDGAVLKPKPSLHGRKPSVRVPYCDNCDQPSCCRILCAAGHETMPYFPGAWFPKRDSSNSNGLFEASMLTLLKPWRSLSRSKDDNETFQNAYNLFLSTASDNIPGTIENIQFYHDCSQSTLTYKESGESQNDPPCIDN